MTRTTRRLSGFFAALHLASLLAAYNHLATTPHGYCTEHGRLIHVDLSRLAPPADPGRPEVRSPFVMRGAHDCAQLEFLVQLATVLGARAPAVGPVSTTGDRRAARPLLAPSPIPLLCLSPKLSPPA